SVEEKRKAISLAKKLGPTTAAARLGLAEGTVSCWSFKARRAGQEGRVWPPAAKASSASRRPTPNVKKRRRKKPVKEVTAKAVRGNKKVMHVYTPSEKAQALELASKKSVTAASVQLGISRFSIYDWQRKVRRAAEGKGDSPTSGSDPADIETKRDNEILNMWREHPGLGPSQIRNQLRRKCIKVSTHTVRRVMEDAGYRLPKVKRQEHSKSFEAVRPNHMWHLDFVHRFISRASTFTLIIIDDCSRYVVGHGVDDAERADMVLNAFEKATERHGKPEMVLHDKGSAFWSWKGIARFTRLLEEMGIDQIAAPYKEWNGKVEVFNANLHKELFDAHKFYDVAEMKRRLAAHLHWYNHRRTSHALGGLLVPADRYFGRMDEVLARIEAGVASDGNDVLSLRDRVLELFKVTSTNGQAEVWLMGQKLFGMAQ
ncbi:DDE-type integrase/transposase/recombinase, partial [Myxococcota bacterium]